MAARKPLVLINGNVEELSSSDTSTGLPQAAPAGANTNVQYHDLNGSGQSIMGGDAESRSVSQQTVQDRSSCTEHWWVHRFQCRFLHWDTDCSCSSRCYTWRHKRMKKWCFGSSTKNWTKIDFIGWVLPERKRIIQSYVFPYSMLLAFGT